jgi:hypothetical protein
MLAASVVVAALAGTVLANTHSGATGWLNLALAAVLALAATSVLMGLRRPAAASPFRRHRRRSTVVGD